MDNTQRDIGALQADVRTVQEDLKDIKADVREMRDMMQHVKGGWKLMLILGTLSAAIGAAFTKIISVLPSSSFLK